MLALFPWVSWGAVLVVVVLAAITRGRLYATFVGVMLSVHTAVACAMAPSFASVIYAYAYFHATAYVHFALLARPRMRPWVYRALVSMPASWFVAATFLAIPWAITRALGFVPYGFFVPYVVAAFGLVQSLRQGFEEIDIALDVEPLPSLRRHRSSALRVDRPLRVAQITDPHLGPFMSEARLRSIVERAVASKPDLVFLTGDFLTMESHHARASLSRALAPLKSFEGRVFACRGNHDLEAPDTVADALADAGVRLLIDEEAVVETPCGAVQIIGIDFKFRERQSHIEGVCARFPRLAGALRLVLLHDPGAFRHLPDGDGDLVFSGHTHGGQLGLVTLGLPTTFVSLFTSIPDHGLWALGKNRLYVHRGTGHYGFPLRVGVPGEESLLRIHPVGR